MKTKIIVSYLVFSVVFFIFPSSDEPQIKLPQVDINIEDKKDLKTDLSYNIDELLKVEVDSIIKPEITDSIKIDLEKTLPDRIDSPDKIKPVDALIKFGYGLNNNLAADFSIFIKEFNPLIAVTYSRRAKDNFWFEERNRRNAYSSDVLNADLTYYKSFFTLNSNIGYAGKSYSLQNQSIYSSLDKKILSLDLNPYIKFNSRNDLSLIVHNSFFFNNTNDGKTTDMAYRNDFDYLLDADLIYSQVIMNNNYLSFHSGYEFNLFDSLTDSIVKKSSRYLFNNAKTGISYSGILKDTFSLNADFDFEGVWRGNEFFWYILPTLKLGYNFKDYMSCYVEGGSSMLQKPGREWFAEHEFVVVPEEIIPGYHWYGKTGIKGMFAGFITGYTDLEFSYNHNGTGWELLSLEEKLFSLVQRDYFSLKLNAGVSASYRQYVKFTTKWSHEFLDKAKMEAADTLNARIDFGIPKVGMGFYAEFNGSFLRKGIDNESINNIYHVNAGLSWSYMERFGLGADFCNIAYFQRDQIKTYYDEPGFEFIVYMKIGF